MHSAITYRMKEHRMIVALMVGAAVVAALLFMASYGAGSVAALDGKGCLACHGNYNMVKQMTDGRKVSLYVEAAAFQNSAHRYIDCTTCHTADPHKVDTPLTKASLAQKCGSCHQYQYEVHQQSIHGQQLRQGNTDVATCVDCHSPTGNPHSVIRVLEPGSPAYRKNQAGMCGKCHGNEELMARYGIVEKVYESYMASFHGKATELTYPALQKLDKATCVNCHGSHDIKSVTDPNAGVATKENLLAVCKSCHANAGPEFVKGFPGHEEVSPQHLPAVYYIGRVFVWLTASVLAFGVLMVTLDLTRLIPIRLKLRRAKAPKKG